MSFKRNLLMAPVADPPPPIFARKTPLFAPVTHPCATEIAFALKGRRGALVFASPVAIIPSQIRSPLENPVSLKFRKERWPK